MKTLDSYLLKALVSYVGALALLFLISSLTSKSGQAAQSAANDNSQAAQQAESSQAAGQETDEAPAATADSSQPEKPVFEKTLPPDKLTFLTSFEGKKSANLLNDKQFRKLIDEVVPDTPIHVGHDRPLDDALELALSGPGQPTRIRDGRYVMISSDGSPQSPFHAFMWVDMQEGIALAGFFWHPSNGEPTPNFTIFSKQLHEKLLAMSDLPLEFIKDMDTWGAPAPRLPVATTYFINSSGGKYDLEHDLDFCSPIDGSEPPPIDVCTTMNADAADNDMSGAYFTKATNHVSNATAYMLDADQVAWIQMRDTTCRNGPDPVACHITMTRERTRVIVGRPPAPPRSAPK